MEYFAIITINVEKSDLDLLRNHEYYENLLTQFCLELGPHYMNFSFGKLFVNETGYFSELENNNLIEIATKLVNNFPNLAFSVYKFEVDSTKKTKINYQIINDELIVTTEQFKIKLPNQLSIDYSFNCLENFLRFSGNYSSFFNIEGHFCEDIGI